MFAQQRVGWMVRDIEKMIDDLGRPPTLDEVKQFAVDVAKTHRTKVLTVKPDPDHAGRFKITSQD